MKTTTIINPYKPLPWQIAPWRDKSSVMLLTGSAGGGKSKCAGEKMHGFCKKYIGAMGVMLRKTRNSMTNSTVLFMTRNVIGRDPQVIHRPSKNRYEYDNGSILAYGGMANEEQREQIRSIGQDGSVDILWMEEATKFTEDDYNEALARMRGKAAPWNQIILTTNPDSATHWINQNLIKNGGASVHYSSEAENPHNPKSYRSNLARLTGVLAKRLREGKWIQAEGAIYGDTWDDSVHLIDSDKVPYLERFVGAADWGFRHPGVLGVFGLDHDGAMYLVAQVYHTGKQIEWWCKRAAELEEEFNIETWACDPSEPAYIEQLRGEAAYNRVRPGIDAVQTRLSERRLHIVRDSLRYADQSLIDAKQPYRVQDEFPGYVWSSTRKEQPVKEKDDGLDMLRYSICYVDNVGEKQLIETSGVL